MHRTGRLSVVILLVFALVASSCGSGSDDDPEVSPTATPTGDGGDGNGNGNGDIVVAGDTSPAAFGVRLSTGTGEVQAAEPIRVVDGDELTTTEVDAVFDRLPEWDVDPTEVQDFNRPADSFPPPRPGTIVDQPFPAEGDVTAPEPPTGPLEVLRFQPEGDVSIAPSVTITFNQPMVPLATLEQLAEEDVPAVLSPELPGTWQWIGTRTLRFEHDSQLIDRLPMARTYEVEIPAGTTSETRGVLDDTVRFEFTTPTVQVTSFGPQHESLDLEPVFVAAFDQRIDPDAVLDTISLTANGSDYDLRLATDDEIQDADYAARAVGWTSEGRFLAFRAVDTLPKNSRVEVAIGPNTPSAEGPRTSSSVERYDARTYGPLELTETWCPRRRDTGPCEPFGSWSIGFTNPLDAQAFDPAWVRVEPELPGMQVGVSWDAITIRGASQGRTTYRVTIAADLVDVFGQRLGTPEDVTFEVGPARPLFGGFTDQFVTVDPSAPDPGVTVVSVNHDQLRVRARAVDPDDLDEYWDWYRNRRGDDDRQPPIGREVLDTEVDVDAEDDQLVETFVDLSDALDSGVGHLIVTIEPDPPIRENDDDYWQNRPSIAWVQATAIGLDAIYDGEQLVAWATDLLTGAPVEGARIELGRATATTDAGGVATLALPGTEQSLLTATRGNDVAAIWRPWDGWESSERADQVRWMVFDDRSLYRPGETVSVKGWVRRLTLSDDAQYELLTGRQTVQYSVRDAQGAEIGTGSTTTSLLGGFDTEIEIPAGTNLGWAYVEFNLTGSGIRGLGGTNHSLSFQVQEFRRPEFEVAARVETPAPHFADVPATVAVEADYFSGGPLPDAEVNWTVSTNDTTYTPPNWQDFQFGVARISPYGPYFFEDDFGGAADVAFGDEAEFFPEPEPLEFEEFSGRTDADGIHYLQMDFESDGRDTAVNVRAQASVIDVNRQAWAAETALVVHAADLYVGLRTANSFTRKGDPLDIDAIVTDLDGNAIAGRDLVVQAQRRENRFVDGKWQDVIADTQTCEVTSGSEPVTCTFETDRGGSYLIVTSVVDDSGRSNRTELSTWVSGGRRRSDLRLREESALLILEEDEYRPGDTVEILVEAPFNPAEGLLTVSRNGIERTERFTIDDFATVLEVPVTDADIPGLHVRVDLAGTTERTDARGNPVDAPDRPAFASGGIQVPVSTESRTLTVEAAPAADTVVPGADTEVDIVVTDASGDPVAGAEVALVVVDEAVLTLANHQLADPIDVFYTGVGSGVRADKLRASIQLASLDFLLAQGVGGDGDSDDTMEDSGGDFAAEAPSADRGTSLGADAPIDVRTDFRALAVFAPEVETGDDGRATTSFTMPDSLTRYRVMAVAVADADHFGSTESAITARLPLMVRPSAPRFLNFGDEFELPIVLQNQTDDDLTVDVAVQAANLELPSTVGRRVTVPANDRIEVRFPAAAAQVGTARFRAVAVSGGLADAAEIALPVYTPATAEAFAVYGVVDSGSIAQPLLAPEGVYPQFGALELGTSSTAVQALTDAVLYMNEYPYRNADGLASRILAVAALRDVLEAFDAEGLPPAAELNRQVQEDIDALVGLQDFNGGFGTWRRFGEPHPYRSVHAMHALAEARANGYSVPEDAIRAGTQFLVDIESYIPSTWGDGTRSAVMSYALFVRNLLGDRDPAGAADVWRRFDLTVESMAWIWPSLDDDTIEDAIERELLNRAVDTASGVTFQTSYGDDAHVILHSSRRTDGIVLDALIAERPASDMIPKIVAGLMAGQERQGHWRNAQENSFILLAMNTYFDTFESQDPDFVARMWLGDLYAAEHVYEGRTTDKNLSSVPMQELIDLGDTDLVVQKDGAGRLYYRLGLRYAPDDLFLDPLDRGFVVQRTYEGVDDPEDVWRDDEGVWHVKAGAEVRVRLSMVADSRRNDVALIDPIPAGLEALNPALAGTPDIPRDVDSDDYWDPWWYWRWFDHQNLRDDRTEAFTSRLWAGVYEYTYVARATTPGTFVTPPTRAEEMYAPETFGRSATDIVVVEG